MLAGLMLAHPYAAACGWQGCWACQYLLLRLPPQIQHCPTAGRSCMSHFKFRRITGGDQGLASASLRAMARATSSSSQYSSAMTTS